METSTSAFDPIHIFTENARAAFDKGASSALLASRNPHLGNLLLAERNLYYLQILYSMLLSRRQQDLEPPLRRPFRQRARGPVAAVRYGLFQRSVPLGLGSVGRLGTGAQPHREGTYPGLPRQPQTQVPLQPHPGSRGLYGLAEKNASKKTSKTAAPTPATSSKTSWPVSPNYCVASTSSP